VEDEVFTIEKSIIWARNLIISKLADYLKIPVRLSNEQDPADLGITAIKP
jgi:hypothetical protein